MAGLVALLIAGVALCVVTAMRVARAGHAARSAAVRAEQELSAGRYDAARQQLEVAQRRFGDMRRDLNLLGPALPVLRVTPFIRIQVRAVEDSADAGRQSTASAERVLDAALELERGSGAPAGPALTAGLRRISETAAREAPALAKVQRRLERLRGYRLVPPLGSVRSEVVSRVDQLRRRVESLQTDSAALADFVGANGPRRWLVFSQNPDEVRPTGGFIGTYGVLAATDGRVRLERYRPIEEWYGAHPEAAVPIAQAAKALRLGSPPTEQTIANVNVTPDWPATAKLAMRLWVRGGERPVDGVVALSPGFLARLLAVTGPVSVPSFPQQVTAANALGLVDYYTHHDIAAASGPGGRKEFISALASVLLPRVATTPRAKLVSLAHQIAGAFSADQVLLWSSRSEIDQALGHHGWTGALPAAEGDFYVQGEFEYSAKNGKGLRRVFTHEVKLNSDGSGTATTDVTITNTQGPSPVYNIDSLSFVTVYGPRRAALGTSSDPIDATADDLAGHPAGSWFRGADPRGSTALRVAWDAPALAGTCGTDCLLYTLSFRGAVDHAGDVLKLSVEPPAGWRWSHGAPPASVSLTGWFTGSWGLERK